MKLNEFRFEEADVGRLLKKLRGKLSQEQMNRKLRCPSNQVSRWESGHSQISWDEFMRFCMAARVPIEKTLTYFFKGHHGVLTASKILTSLSGNLAPKNIAAQSGFSYAKIRRWGIGETEPSLMEFLQFIYQMNSSLLIELLVQLKVLSLFPALAEEHQKMIRWKKEYYRDPRLQLVLYAFELKPYRLAKKHVNGFLSATLGISPREEDALIQKALTLGWLNQDPVSKKYVPLNVKWTSFSNNEEAIKVREYWTLEGIKKLQRKKTQQTEDVFGNVVLRLTLKQKQELTSRLLDIISDFSEKNSEGSSELIQVFGVQLFSPSDT